MHTWFSQADVRRLWGTTALKLEVVVVWSECFQILLFGESSLVLRTGWFSLSSKREGPLSFPHPTA